MRADDCPTIDTAGFLLSALEQVNDGVVIVDGDFRISHFNAAAEKIWGVDRAGILGSDAGCLGLGGLQNNDPPAEIRVKHGDGRRIRAELSISQVEIEGDSHYLVLARDVTAEVARRERISLLMLVADKTDRVCVVTDRRLRIIYSNAAFTAMFGYSPAQAEGRDITELLGGPHTDPAMLARLRRLIASKNGGEEEILAYDSQGDEIWVSTIVKPFRSHRGRAKYICAMLSDVSETKQLRSLQQLIMGALADEWPLTEIAEQLCRRVEAIAPDVICSVLHIDADGLIHPLGGPSLPCGFSRPLEGMVIGPEVGSCGAAAYHGEPVLTVDIDTDPRWRDHKALALAAGLRACWSTPIKAKDGRVIGTFAFYFRESRAPSRWHQRIVDSCVHLGALAIERKEARAQIARLAYHDMLTGLPNRTQLRQLVDQTISECSAGQHVALVFLDLDHFKDINDTLGHSAGDDLLVELTNRLRGQIGPEDRLGRLGGDEFVLALADCDAARASQVASRITEALRPPLRLGARHVPVSASMGISLYPDNATDIDTLMRQADAAMYKAKQAGRATHRFFSADMDQLAEQRLIYTTALRRAVADGGLKLHYQPQKRIDGSLYGIEALARWHDPVLGEVSPLKFIPLAEECGLIEQIGLWSIREACRQMAAWREAGVDIPCVSVNLSPINFQNRGLAATVAEILAARGLPPDALMLEITESVLMNERSTAIATMNAIRALGVGLSLDDFGTGYSSLSRLALLPIRELKIDRAFMRDIEQDPNAMAIATAVIRVGQSLNMTVVAEGVETEGQRVLLQQLGCDVVQGYLFAPAMPPEKFERWLVSDAADQAAGMLRRLGQSLKPAPVDAQARQAR